MPTRNRLCPIQVLDLPSGVDYDEVTFRYLLSMEQARAARAHRPLRLLMVTLDGRVGRSAPFPPQAAARVFDALRLALRDTDFVGWYEQGRTVGAVLTLPTTDTLSLPPLERRLAEELRQRLPGTLAARLRIRIAQRVVGEPSRERGTA